LIQKCNPFPKITGFVSPAPDLNINYPYIMYYVMSPNYLCHYAIYRPWAHLRSMLPHSYFNYLPPLPPVSSRSRSDSRWAMVAPEGDTTARYYQDTDGHETCRATSTPLILDCLARPDSVTPGLILGSNRS